MNIFKKLALRASVNLSGANSIFGTLGAANVPVGTSYGFIPMDNKGTTLDLTGDGSPKWLGLQSKPMQHWAYVYVSPLAAVIDRIAEADTNGIISFSNLNGDIIKNVNKIPSLSRITRLFANPNPMQTWEEFNSEQIVQCKKHGYCPVYSFKPVGFDNTYTKYLFNLDPLKGVPIRNSDFTLTNGQNTISYWNFGTYNGEQIRIDSENIILVKDGYTQDNLNLGLPLSKMVGLDFVLSNICFAMEADNVLLRKKGPLGVFSYDPKPDMAGWTPMKPGEKKELQSDLDKYGMTLGQLQHIISKVPLKWNPISFDAKSLMTKETIRQAIDFICDRYGYPAELMSGKNATYENRDSAEKFFYQNNVIPFSLRRMAKYNSFFGLDNIGYKMYMDFDHLPVLQEDLMKAGQAYKDKSTGLDIAWKDGIITLNEWRTSMSMDTVSDGDIYYEDYAKKNKINQNAPTPKSTGA